LYGKMIRLRTKAMTQDLIDRSRQRHTLTDRTLVALIVALVAALAVATVTVSIGIARTGTLAHIAADSGGRLTLAMVLALIVAGMGGLTAAVVRDEKVSPRRD
jgi:hypothetical protein